MLGLLTCPFKQVCSPPRTKPPGRNSYVIPEFRVLVHTVSGPYSHVPSAFAPSVLRVPSPQARMYKCIYHMLLLCGKCEENELVSVLCLHFY